MVVVPAPQCWTPASPLDEPHGHMAASALGASKAGGRAEGRVSGEPAVDLDGARSAQFVIPNKTGPGDLC